MQARRVRSQRRAPGLRRQARHREMHSVTLQKPIHADQVLHIPRVSLSRHMVIMKKPGYDVFLLLRSIR